MRILVIEDNKRTASLVKEGLVINHFAADICEDFESGISAAIDPDYDLVLIDRRLPGDKDGLDICSHMRKLNIDTPVIMLTAQGEINDRVQGLKLGADDYIVKPFSINELVARIQAISRRPRRFKSSVYKLDGLTVDVGEHRAFFDKKTIELTPKEYGILVLLLQNINRPISKDYIVSHVWDGDADILPSSIESYISSLRRKIHKSGHKKELIQTVWGVGYSLSSKDNV